MYEKTPLLLRDRHQADGLDDQLPEGWEEVPDTNLSALAVALAWVGFWVGRALLAVGLVCFLAVLILMAADAGVRP